MRKINKFKLLFVFCFAFIIISLGVYALISAQYPCADAAPHAYGSDNVYVVMVPEEVPDEIQDNVFEYGEIFAQMHYAYNEIVPPKYDMVRDFHNGYAVVMIGNVWSDELKRWESGFYGLIDKAGTLVLPLIYDHIEGVVIINDIALVSAVYDGKCGIVNLHGEEVLPFIYARLSIRYGMAFASYGEGDNRTAGLFCLTANEFIVPKGIYFAINHLASEGRAWVTLGPENEWRWGVIDINSGELLTPMVYVSRAGLGLFINGLARVHRDTDDGIKSGLLDINGNEITEFIYDNISGLRNNVIEVSRNGKWGLIDTEGNYVVEPTFDSAQSLHRYVRRRDFRYFPAPHMYGGADGIYDNFAIVRNNLLTGILNLETGEYIVPSGYMHFYTMLGNGLVLASKGTRGDDYKMGIIDVRTGSIVADFIYNDMSWRIYEDEVIRFLYGAEWELRDWDGTEWYGLLGGRWGLMDLHGNEITSALYSSIRHLISDLFIVSYGNGNGIINTSGEIVLPIEYTHIGSFWHSHGYDIALAPVNIGAQWVWSLNVESYEGFGGYALTGGKWGFIDISGNLVVPAELEYDYVNSVVDGMAAVMRDGKWGFIAVTPDT